ncbi:type VI secretion system ImpA family N-terminal domain-containing protein [Enterobacter kobei]|uniref:type VI secretion system ImpA family N-terminal domain-containing protein n=1 Tax=Enterobacter kobei TaxID=208224 RepID=UPI0006807ADF|nr:type VI secretion system ImpA family N-terminal domain-containing protein [Enterobacter kobei]
MEYRLPDKIKTGGNPCALPDYAALRDELSKLTHPARPDVDWRRVQSLCLRLFEHNGVELQSACWYTLARMHTAGLAGMNDGLFITGTLVRDQWPVMWPACVHARTEILAGLSQRLQNVLRTLMLNDRDDLHALYQSEKCLAELGDCLARHELRPECRLDGLQHEVRSAITRLENNPQDARDESCLLLPLQGWVPAESDDQPVLFVWSAEPESESVLSAGIFGPWRRRLRLQAFALGTLSTLIFCGLLSWGIHVLYRPMPEEHQLEATLTPLPQPLSPTQLNRLWHDSTLTETESGRLIDATRQQLAWLQSLPPDWAQQYGRHLIRQALTLWPDNPDVISMQANWQKMLKADALPLSELHGLHESAYRQTQCAP